MWLGAAIAFGAAALVVVLSLGRKGRDDMAADGVLGHDPAVATDTAVEARSTDVAAREPALVGVGATAGHGREEAEQPAA
jgi:hypothetical protein